MEPSVGGVSFAWLFTQEQPISRRAMVYREGLLEVLTAPFQTKESKQDMGLVAAGGRKVVEVGEGLSRV